jgi:hypothetical protein
MLVVMVQVWTVLPPTCRLTDSWPLTPRARTVIELEPPPEELELLEEVELELLEDEEELEELLDDELEPPSAGGVPLNPSCPSRVIANTR